VQERLCAVGGFSSASLLPPPSGCSLSDIFDARFLSTLDAATGVPRPALVAKLLTEECEGVYSFPLLKPSFCENLVECGYQFTEHLKGAGRDADMPRMLDLMDLKWLNDLLLELVVNPLAQLTMQDQLQGEALDYRHGYIVGYGPMKQKRQESRARGAEGEEESRASEDSNGESVTGGDVTGGDGAAKPGMDTSRDYRHRRDHLVAHSDDAEATLNVGLATDFDGGDLIFYGARGSGDEMTPQARYRHPHKGHAVLHVGRQLHEVAPVTRGNRYGLIMWARSIKGVRQGVCPCCWMNGRDAVLNACICGPRWN
jgi:hypothetical protein